MNQVRKCVFRKTKENGKAPPDYCRKLGCTGVYRMFKPSIFCNKFLDEQRWQEIKSKGGK